MSSDGAETVFGVVWIRVRATGVALLRLLDHVAQCREPFMVRRPSGDLWRLPGPSDHAEDVVRCPLRYVVTNDLLRACVDLAYSEGIGLSACLDLVHFPAERLWVEWDSGVQQEAIARLLPECLGPPSTQGIRQGVLITADSAGRTGHYRTFWLPSADAVEPMLAAVETFIDLNGDLQPSPAELLLEGRAVGIRDRYEGHIDSLLRCATFRLNEAWHRYYVAAARTATEREAVIRASLSTVAFDAPVLIALFLLLSLHSEIVRAPVTRERLNIKRLRHGKRPLLAHIEVSSPVFAVEPRREVGSTPTAARTAPRMHQVRGHLVRRDNVVFWRRSHWRGHLRVGRIQSRTVTLRLPTAAVRLARTT